MNGLGRVASRVACVVGALVVAVLVVELGLRLLADEERADDAERRQMMASAPLFEFDPELGWRGRALASGSLRTPAGTILVKLNSQGVREREVPFERSRGSLRVVVLGDSQTWGSGVTQDDRFSDVLERLLRERGIDAEVVNLGIPGYGTDQELLLFRRLGRRYRPDLVIVAFYWNDVFENSSTTAYGYPKPRFVLVAGELRLTNVPVPTSVSSGPGTGERRARGGLKTWLEAHAATYRLVAGAVRRSAVAYEMLAALGVAGGPRRDPESAEWKVTRRLLERLRAEVHAADAAFLVAILPERADVDTASHDLKRALLADLARLGGVDLTPAVREGKGTRGNAYLPRDIHLSPEGHRLVALGLVEQVLRSGGPAIGAAGGAQAAVR